MKILDDTAVVLPLWVRVVFVGFAAAFAGLAVWLAGLREVGWGAAAGVVVSASLCLLLLVAAIRGRTWKWMWFIPWVPGP